MNKEHSKEVGQNEPLPKHQEENPLISIIAVGLFFYVIFLLIRGFFRALTRKPEEPEMAQIPVFTTENIGRNYTALGMVKSSSTDETGGMKELERQAIAMNADAIVAMQMNISNDTSGKVSTGAFSRGYVHGKTSTKTTYHFMGTAVKFNESPNNE